MRIRILTNGKNYRLQKRFFFVWCNIDLNGKMYHPERMSHEGHDQVNKVSEIYNKIDLILKNEHHSKSKEWKVLNNIKRNNRNENR